MLLAKSWLQGQLPTFSNQTFSRFQYIYVLILRSVFLWPGRKSKAIMTQEGRRGVSFGFRKAVQRRQQQKLLLLLLHLPQN
jgi:hypothetical protein